MKRPSANMTTRPPNSGSGGGKAATMNGLGCHDTNGKYTKPKRLSRSYYSILLCITSFVFGMIVRNNMVVFVADPSSGNVAAPPTNSGSSAIQQALTSAATPSALSSEMTAFAAIRSRAVTHQHHCHSLGLSQADDFAALQLNNHTAHLPQSGIVDAIDSYVPNKQAYPYECTLPPETECDETQFTVIFMAYNPDRLEKLLKQIKLMLTHPEFAPLVAECLIVWNGERHVDETPLGKELVEYSKSHALRISYPLQAGFPNDLMNRYHPRLDVKTKAVMVCSCSRRVALDWWFGYTLDMIAY